MRPNLDEEWVELIWKHSILPYVEEQLFGQTERIGEFELDRLRNKGGQSEAQSDGQADEAPEPGGA